MLESNECSLTGLWLPGQRGGGMSSDAAIVKRTSVLQDACAWLDDYFSKKRPCPTDLPLAPAGGLFRQEVWALLLKIPYGRTATYGEIAKEVACRMNKMHMSAQAVGGAVGHNPISIIIPCHRVVGAHGNLTGYAGGMDKKIELLKIEEVDLSGMFVPHKHACRYFSK